MIYRGIGATTEIDRHNCKISKEALDNASKQINEGGSVPRVGLNHDRTIMPFGKIIEAEVLPIGNGEYKMEITQDEFDIVEEVHINNDIYVINKSSIDNRPFIEEELDSDSISVGFDMNNFESKNDMTEILQIIENYNAHNYSSMRKSLIPDPELVIILTKGITNIILYSKVYDSIGDRVLNNLLDDLDNFYAFIRELVIKYAKLAIPKNRPQTYVFKMENTYSIELIVVTTNPEDVIEAIKMSNLDSISDKISELTVHFTPKSVQFVYSEGTWNFNYMCTDKGEVIGTLKSYSRRVKELELFKNGKEKISVSVGGKVNAE